MPAKVSYLATLYYQSIIASSVQCCSGQTDGQYLATAPGNKIVILQCLVTKIVAASYNKLARYNLMIQTLPAKIHFVSF